MQLLNARSLSMRTQTQPSIKPVAAPKRTAARRKPSSRSGSAVQPALGSPEWQQRLHPKVRQFLDASGKLDWSELP
jgi:hypothetical protein